MYLGIIGPWQLVIILIAVGIFILPVIIALIDILRNEFTGYNKIVWLLVIFFMPVIGAILYFLIGRSQRVKTITQ